MGFFKDLFDDDNTINEKSVIGFASFLVMVGCITVDLLTGYMGKELVINEYVFNAFLTLTLGSFGIASVDKFVNKKAENDKLNHLDSIQPEPTKEEEELG
jgi:ABC-type uncharacterized transport system permease subunit